MSKRYWLPIIATAGLAVLAGLAFLYWPDACNDTGYHGSPSKAASAVEQKTDPCSDPEASAIRRIACAIEAIRSNQESQNETERAQSDLDAQWKMAYWARCMFWATVAQVLLGAFGLFGLIATIFYTHKTLRLSTSTSQAQLRAYVLVETAAIGWDAKQPIAQIRIKNFGATPAKDVTHWVGAEFGSKVDFKEPAKGTIFQSKSTFAPTGTLDLTCNYDPVDRTLYEKILSAQETLYVFGKIEYIDIFGEKRETAFRMVSKKAINNRIPLTPCDEGNSYT